MSTIFDRIISGEIPCFKVWEDAEHLAFLDVNPRCVGHTLVIPKTPVDYLFGMDDAAYTKLQLAAKTVACLLKKKLACRRVAVGVWGFEVAHAHIHLFPANAISDAAPPAVNEAAKASLEETHKRISA